MTVPPRHEWHGEWLSMSDLAKMFGKSRLMIWKWRKIDPNVCAGVRLVRVRDRIWARVDRSLLPTRLP
jgi:methyl coenzyme M reductase gamma subunit